jgi:hypothetical protein
MRRARRHLKWVEFENLNPWRGVVVILLGVLVGVGVLIVAELGGQHTLVASNVVWAVIGAWVGVHLVGGGFIVYAGRVVAEMKNLSYTSSKKVISRRWIGLDEAMVRLMYLGGAQAKGISLFRGGDSFDTRSVFTRTLSTEMEHTTGFYLGDQELSDVIQCLEEHCSEIGDWCNAVTACCSNICDEVTDEAYRGERGVVVPSIQALARCSGEAERRMFLDILDGAQLRGTPEGIIHEVEMIMQRMSTCVQ